MNLECPRKRGPVPIRLRGCPLSQFARPGEFVLSPIYSHGNGKLAKNLANYNFRNRLARDQLGTPNANGPRKLGECPQFLVAYGAECSIGYNL